MTLRNPPAGGSGNSIVFKLHRRRESVTAEEILRWMRDRPGIFGEVTIRDVENAIDGICR